MSVQDEMRQRLKLRQQTFENNVKSRARALMDDIARQVEHITGKPPGPADIALTVAGLIERCARMELHIEELYSSLMWGHL